MENIDIIIVAGISFLLVVGGLFIGMYFARRTEAARVAKLDEREDRLLRMRARFEHERFAVSAEDSDGDVLLDEDLFKGFKEELEQERMELDMRREELELDMRMLEEENERLKSRLPSGRSADAAIESDAEEATIVEEATVESSADIEDAVFEEPPEDEEINDDDVPQVTTDPEPESDLDDDDTSFDSAEDRLARNTIFGDFYFDESPEDDLQDFGGGESGDDDQDEVEDDPEPVDDGWTSEPDEIQQPEMHVQLTEPVGGDGAAGDRPPDALDRTEPARAAFDHMLTSDGEGPVDGSFEEVLGLSKRDLALMNDLGYGTFRSITDLSDGEIERLAAAFDIPERTIRDEWIPNSRMRVAREPRV